MEATVRRMTQADIVGAVALQRACFPAPFPEELLWSASHLAEHLRVFPEGQFVVDSEDRIVASASNAIVDENVWQAHLPWAETLGGPELSRHDPRGTTLYGVDVSVHPAFRRRGLARALYEARFALVRSAGLARYGTACRIPDFRAWSLAHKPDLDGYLGAVASGDTEDRTLTPLLRLGLALVGGIRGYMDDEESLDCAALLEWMP